MANIDISKLPPALQAAIFAASKQSGQQPTSNMGETSPLSAPDQEAQQQQPQIQQQEGDQMHPMDAIHQIGQQMMGPQAPAGISLATGPKLQQGPTGMSAQVPSSNPLMRLFGAKQSVPFNNPNYFAAIQNNPDLMKFLPSGLAQTPDGTPFVGPKTYENALNSQKTMVGQGKEIYTTLDQLTSQGIPEDTARSLMAANPRGVTSKEVSNQMGSERLKSVKEMADARATMAGVARLGQALKVGGFDAAQPMAQQAGKNLMVVQKAQPLIDQIVAQGGKADVRQQAELAGNIAMLTANNSGVLTDQRMNEFLPNSIIKKYGGWKEYFQNGQEPVDFSGFLGPLQDLLTREKTANQGVMSAASQLGINIMGITQPNTATAISNARNASPLVGNGQVSPTVTPPITKPQGTAPVAQPQSQPPPQLHFNNPIDIKAAYQAGKLTIDQAKALVKSMHKGGN